MSKAKDSITTDKRAALHRALDAIMDTRRVKDAKPDGLISDDEEEQEQKLTREVMTDVKRWKAEAYKIGGSFRGPGIWSRISRILKSA